MTNTDKIREFLEREQSVFCDDCLSENSCSREFYKEYVDEYE